MHGQLRRGDLFDVRRLAGAVIALDHHPAVEGKTGQNGQRGFAIETIGRIFLGNIFGVALGKRGHAHVRIDPEGFANVDGDIGRGGRIEALGLSGHQTHPDSNFWVALAVSHAGAERLAEPA